MADNALAIEREHDKRILITIVTDIRTQLEIIVFRRRDLFRKEFQPHFPGPWRDVEGRLTLAVNSLERDDFNWEYVENAAWYATLFNSKGICLRRQSRKV
jgi:hypothetical protein